MTETWLAPYLDRMEEISRLFFRHFHARIEAAGGLSPSQFFVLKVLQMAGTLTVGDLAQKMGMSTAGATGLIDRLVRSELVERTRDENDRRVVWIRLSEEGARQFGHACAQRRAILAELFAALTPDEVAQLVNLFEKVSRSVPAPDPGPDLPTKE